MRVGDRIKVIDQEIYGKIIHDYGTEVVIEDDSEIDDGFDSQYEPLAFPVFVLTKGNASGEPDLKISVSQDEEGNGSGYLFIEEENNG